MAGGGDQAANAVGVGVVSPGTMALSLGTSGVVFAATDRPLFEPRGRVHAFCHAVPGRWHLMSVMLSAAGSLRWFRDALAPGASFADLVASAGDVPAGQRRPVLPALSVRRAQPASRPVGAGRVRRPDARARSAAHDPGGARGRRVRPARRAGPHDRGRHARARPDPRVGRRHWPARSGVRSWPTSSAPRSRPSRRPRVRRTAPASWPPWPPAGTRPSRRPRMPSCASRRSPHPDPTRPAYAERHAVYRELYPALAPTFPRL